MFVLSAYIRSSSNIGMSERRVNQFDILPEFQPWLQQHGIGPEHKIPYYAWWASLFLVLLS